MFPSLDMRRSETRIVSLGQFAISQCVIRSTEFVFIAELTGTVLTFRNQVVMLLGYRTYEPDRDPVANTKAARRARARHQIRLAWRSQLLGVTDLTMSAVRLGSRHIATLACRPSRGTTSSAVLSPCGWHHCGNASDRLCPFLYYRPENRSSCIYRRDGTWSTVGPASHCGFGDVRRIKLLGPTSCA